MSEIIGSRLMLNEIQSWWWKRRQSGEEPLGMPLFHHPVLGWMSTAFRPMYPVTPMDFVEQVVAS